MTIIAPDIIRVTTRDRNLFTRSALRNRKLSNRGLVLTILRRWVSDKRNVVLSTLLGLVHTNVIDLAITVDVDVVDTRLHVVDVLLETRHVLELIALHELSHSSQIEILGVHEELLSLDSSSLGRLSRRPTTIATTNNSKTKHGQNKKTHRRSKTVHRSTSFR